jgi:hypothetical protein
MLGSSKLEKCWSEPVLGRRKPDKVGRLCMVICVEDMVHRNPILHCAQQKAFSIELQRSNVMPFVERREQTSAGPALLTANADARWLNRLA